MYNFIFWSSKVYKATTRTVPTLRKKSEPTRMKVHYCGYSMGNGFGTRNVSVSKTHADAVPRGVEFDNTREIHRGRARVQE